MKCRVCHEYGASIDTISAKDNYYQRKGTFDYWLCGKCHSWNILAVPKDLAEHYTPPNKADNYYAHIEFDGKQDALQRGRAIQAIEKLKLTEKDSVLDFGGGSLKQAYSYYKNGIDTVRTYDPFAKEQEYTEDGITFKLQNTLPTDRQFTMINSTHSIEHAPDCEDYLRQVHSCNTSGGHLLIECPVTGFSISVHKSLSPCLDAPRHLFIPSVNALIGVLDKVGYITEAWEYIFYPFSIMFADLYKKGLSYNQAEVEKAKLSNTDLVMYSAVAEYITRNNMGDVIQLIAKKR